MNVCEICGSTEEDTRIIGTLCRKHYLQKYRHGNIIERTIFDKNDYELDGDVVIMTLFNKRCEVTGFTKFDTSDYDRVKNIKWYKRQKYVMGSVDGRKVFLHRFIMNTPNDMFTDHINGDVLDNRKCNLRVCTKAENTRNRANRLRVAGVSLVPSGRYSAVITVQYKVIYLGTFDTEDEAIQARIDAEIEYFGEYSVSNG